MKIAVIGNLHDPLLKKAFGFTGRDRHSFYESFMERLFSIPADLYVSIGDLTTIDSIDELEKIQSIIHHHQKPFVHVFGKHEVPSASRQEILQIIGQDRFHKRSTPHSVLAFLDTTLAQDYGDSAGSLDLVQQQWLETVMKESGSRALIVFGHHPAPSPVNSLGKETCCLPPITPLLNLLDKKQGAGLYVNGHRSANSLALKAQWTFLQLAPVVHEEAVRIIEISEALITIDYVPFILPAKEAVHQHLDPHPLGKEIDVKYAIPLPQPTLDESNLNTKINSY